MLARHAAGRLLGRCWAEVVAVNRCVPAHPRQAYASPTHALFLQEVAACPALPSKLGQDVAGADGLCGLVTVSTAMSHQDRSIADLCHGVAATGPHQAVRTARCVTGDIPVYDKNSPE